MRRPRSLGSPARLASPVRDPPSSAAAEGRPWFALPGRADHRPPGADAGFAGVHARVSWSWESWRRQAADADSPRGEGVPNGPVFLPLPASGSGRPGQPRRSETARRAAEAGGRAAVAWTSARKGGEGHGGAVAQEISALRFHQPTSARAGPWRSSPTGPCPRSGPDDRLRAITPKRFLARQKMEGRLAGRFAGLGVTARLPLAPR